MALIKTKCYKCQHELEFNSIIPFSRQESCPKCFTDLKCCNMCQFFDLHADNQCREPQAERIIDKAKANFCSYFKLTSASIVAGANSQREELLNKARSLFKN